MRWQKIKGSRATYSLRGKHTGCEYHLRILPWDQHMGFYCRLWINSPIVKQIAENWNRKGITEIKKLMLRDYIDSLEKLCYLEKLK
jgi:hypothetical protein